MTPTLTPSCCFQMKSFIEDLMNMAKNNAEEHKRALEAAYEIQQIAETVAAPKPTKTKPKRKKSLKLTIPKPKPLKSRSKKNEQSSSRKKKVKRKASNDIDWAALIAPLKTALENNLNVISK